MHRTLVLVATLLLVLACGGCRDKPDAPESGTQQATTRQQGAQEGAPRAAPRQPVANANRQLPRTYKAVAPVVRELYSIGGQKRTLDVARAPALPRDRAAWRVNNIDRFQNKQPALIGGFRASVDEWPWAAALLVDFYGDGWLYLYCGGSLVAPGWVLTAAHCDVALSDVIIVGEANLVGSAGSAVGVNMVCPHENFNIDTNDYDLALVKLRTSVTKTPVPLDDLSAIAGQTPTSATVIGWGAVTQGGTYSTDLMAAKLPLVPDSDCSSAYPSKITPNMLCAGVRPGPGDTPSPGACRGDSGGPLMANQTASLNWFQVGVTSWGDDCSTPQNYGVYTRVSQLRQWIDATIAGNNPLCPVND